MATEAEAHYRQMFELSQRMLVAGMAQHWDELVDLEQQRRALLDNTPVSTRTESLQVSVELIQQIQECDSRLREKLDAWMAHARILLRLDSSATPRS